MEGDRERPKYLMPEVPGQILSRQMIVEMGETRGPREGKSWVQFPVGVPETKVLSARCVVLSA